MTETALAAGDLITAIPSLWQALQIPLAIIAICVGGVAGAFSLVRGFGAAAGKVLGESPSRPSSSAVSAWR